MNIKKVIYTVAGVLFAGSLSVQGQVIDPLATVKSNNVGATQAYGPTAIQPQIRLNLENDTDKIHFIRNNTDPYVVTKVYEVKNTDVYELRPLIISAIRTKKITQDNTYVEAIKYNNGASYLIVSAEADRFGKQNNGMGIDEIITALDQPKLINSSGTVRYVYFPKYRSANELRTLLLNVGTTTTYNATTGLPPAYPAATPIYAVDSSWELQQGRDVVLVEESLNALFFAIPAWSKKVIDAQLQFYDQPILQAEVKFTVYEIYAENDGKIGLDFQSWKNNDGTDLFAVGGRYRSNWANTFAGGIDQNGANKTQFFNFNPKWNSKYLDFLVSKGHAKVKNSGNVLVKNNEVATINSQTKVFYDQYTDSANKTLSEYTTVGNQITALGGTYAFTASNNGNAITINGGIAVATSLSAVRITLSPSTYRYQLALTGPASFLLNGKDFGQEITADTFSLTVVATGLAVPWTTNIAVAKGPTINTLPSGAFGFVMTVSPQICQDSTKLTVTITNSSLIGWKSNGDPRIATNDTITTDVFIGNKGNRFVIGGINKENVVRSVTGIPYLREIPGLGWLFETESESSKKSQLVVTAEVNTKSIYAQLTEGVGDSIKKIEKGTEGAGEKVEWGFDQYMIDKKL